MTYPHNPSMNILIGLAWTACAGQGSSRVTLARRLNPRACTWLWIVSRARGSSNIWWYVWDLLLHLLSRFWSYSSPHTEPNHMDVLRTHLVVPDKDYDYDMQLLHIWRTWRCWWPCQCIQEQWQSICSILRPRVGILHPPPCQRDPVDPKYLGEMV